MKKTVMTMVMVAVFAACVNAWGATPSWTPPTAAQITAAAANPAQLAALLNGASVQQAAEVVRNVVVAVLQMGLAAPAQTTKINSIIGAAFQAVPQMAPEAPAAGKIVTLIPGAGAAVGSQPTNPDFATALGDNLGKSPMVFQNVAVVVALKAAVAANAGAGAAATAVTTAFNTALTTSVETSAREYNGQ
jgi:hypothetical protein